MSAYPRSNRATLGGSLAEADPHGDWPPVVLAADETVQLRRGESERALPASEFFAMNGDGHGRKRTAPRTGELLTAVAVPAAGARTRGPDRVCEVHGPPEDPAG